MGVRCWVLGAGWGKRGQVSGFRCQGRQQGHPASRHPHPVSRMPLHSWLAARQALTAKMRMEPTERRILSTLAVRRSKPPANYRKCSDQLPRASETRVRTTCPNKAGNRWSRLTRILIYSRLFASFAGSFSGTVSCLMPGISRGPSRTSRQAQQKARNSPNSFTGTYQGRRRWNLVATSRKGRRSMYASVWRLSPDRMAK